ncbi:hypothetical protein JAAARDRAFT_162193 [Jaapia argillacea MUCL 33604]|uniref:PCI domain-containing protein n=1 Tax=Jaapia argillacea MUCL 33604 TaxID=933084 RepID=A0A067PDL2_9AGAM|nr:hypothetical protein JAAARDRAFT_162193 [Jaapia argillacea MUCL 33604]
MELGTGFTAKLEPFLLMAKSAKGAAAAKLIQDATSAPGVFVFAELLDLPNIQEVGVSYYHLLQLFSYRTYRDYLQHKDSLPALSQAQVTKLKHLSLVSLAMERRILPYRRLLQDLQMPTIRDLEDLIIDAIYMDVLRGRLDQKEQQFEVEYTMGRDLEPGKVESILAALKDWASTTSAVLTTLDVKLSELSSHTLAKKTADEEYEKAVTQTLRDVLDKQKEGAGAGGAGKGVRRGGAAGPFGGVGNMLGIGDGRAGGRGDVMDVDDPEHFEGAKGKNRKAPLSDATAKQQRKRNRF